MARIQRLTRVGVASFLLAICGLFLSPGARAANLNIAQGDAYSACAAHIGYAYPPDPSITVVGCHVYLTNSNGAPSPGGTCAATTDHAYGDAGYYMPQWSNGNGDGDWGSFRFCLPVACVVGDTPDGTTDQNYTGFSMATGRHCKNNGCGYVMHLSYAGKPAGGSDADGVSVGYFVGDGSYCVASYGAIGEPSTAVIPVAPVFVPSTPCPSGQASCLNPDRGFCAVSESGEWNCVSAALPGHDLSGCASGATGEVCTAKDGTIVPAPSDPPIAKGTPATTNNYTINDGTTNYNVTQNSYSGTSPGSGDSGSSSSPGGTGTNSTGSGNSGSKGTDSSGKCADGSVPTASGCSGSYRDNGCDTPPACFGDAVLCATAVNTHKIACNPASSSSIGTAADALAAAGVPADGGASTDPSSSGLVTSSDLGSDGFDASGLGFSRSCPANPQFSVLGRSYTFDLGPFCSFASTLGLFVLLVAYLVGLRIVATGRS